MSSKGDIFDQVAAPKGDIFDQVSPDKKEISKTRSVLSAPLKGAIKGAEELSKFADPTQILLNVLAPQKESMLSQLSERVLPTKDEPAERFLERAGKIAPNAALGGAGIIPAIIQTLAGAAGGEIAKEEGLGETGQGIAEAVSMGLPGLIKAAGTKAASLLKAPVQKMASGLTKSRAVGAKLAEKAVISPARQEKTIANLNREASKLAETTLKKEVPLAEQIKNGVDFESQFQQRFGALEKMAERANPEIDISPVSKMMSETASKYRGIPKLHPEAAKIKGEVKAFGNRAPTDLKSALRTYRSNNKKIKGIYETSRLTGKQQEYVDFLVDYNKKIAESFENTLPKDSAWVKEFKDTNKFYKGYRDAQKTMAQLEPILGQKPTPGAIRKLANDAKAQQKLELSMGKKGADEIVQIAKDLELATESIKNIPARELKAWDLVLPLSIFVPGVKIPGAVVTGKKALDFSRRGYGIFLTTAARRKSYSNALKAINDGNKAAYIKSAQELEKSFNQDTEESSS